jgi:hypothetical protein
MLIDRLALTKVNFLVHIYRFKYEGLYMSSHAHTLVFDAKSTQWCVGY